MSVETNGPVFGYSQMCRRLSIMACVNAVIILMFSSCVRCLRLRWSAVYPDSRDYDKNAACYRLNAVLKITT